MNLANFLKYRLWLFVTLLAVGVLIGVLTGPVISSYTARTASASQELASQPIEADEGVLQQTIAPTLAARQETVATTSDEPQIILGEVGTYKGIPAGLTEEGYPYLGDADAPITIEEYSDFLCPFCARHYDQTVPILLDEYVSSGQVKYVFRDMPLVGLHPTAPIGHMAASCVADQGAGLFWVMHDRLFARQSEWSRLPDPHDFVAGVAQEVGADMAAYQDCMTSGGKDSQVQESIAAGEALGFNGTPSFQFIQNESGQTYILVGALPVDTFAQWLDALIAGEAPPQEEQEEAKPPELPFWATPEGLAPDPDRPGFTLAGDPYKGSPNAKLVVVEFADFQCDSCQRHALETQPVVDEQFVDTGDTMWVFKALPLKEHAHAPAAAVAAECAAYQDKFWDMHHLLFERLEQWSNAADTDSAFMALAQDLELNMDQFGVCFNSRQALEQVLSDMYDAQGVVQTTPSFVFLFNGRGRLSSGTLPADQFVRRLQGLLDEANAGE